MAYTVSVPLPNQKIAATQAPIQANFAFINSAMQDNHTFNGNPIAGEADGSHQRLDFPNQVSDIGVLPSGIAAVEYCKGGNIFSYNGTKNPMSGYSGSGTNTFPGTFPIVTVPADSIGFLVVQNTVSGGTFFNIGFMSIGGTLRISNSASTGNLTLSVSSLTINVAAASGTSIFKYIYWPV
jgi:hypothetical protein